MCVVVGIASMLFLTKARIPPLLLPILSDRKHWYPLTLKDVWLEMCFLVATDSDVVFMEEMLQVCLLVEDSLCVPMHHIDWLMSIGCS